MPKLNVRHSQQLKSNHCWAACAEMLTNYYKVTTSQIAFAGQAMISIEGMDNMNMKATAMDVGTLIQKLAPSINMGWTREGSDVPMKFNEIKEKIDNGFPIIGFANNHAMLIVGYEMVNGNTPAIHFHDPDKQEGPSLTYYHTYAQNWVAAAWVKSFSLHASDAFLFGVD